MRWCWVNFQCRASCNLDYSRARASALAVGAGWGCLDIFLSSIISVLSPSLWETTRYRLKYYVKTQTNNQPTSKPNAGRIAVGSASDLRARGPRFDTRSMYVLLFLLPLFKEGQTSVPGDRTCNK